MLPRGHQQQSAPDTGMSTGTDRDRDPPPPISQRVQNTSEMDKTTFSTTLACNLNAILAVQRHQLLAMLTTIPEVDLVIECVSDTHFSFLPLLNKCCSTRLRKIEETEKAKLAIPDGRRTVKPRQGGPPCRHAPCVSFFCVSRAWVL
jgi:hypothetical protein